MKSDTKFVIPTKVILPGGYVIGVKILPEKKYRAKGGHCKAIQHMRDCIYLQRDRTPAQRRADFLHEMLHVVADWQVYSFDRPDVDPKG